MYRQSVLFVVALAALLSCVAAGSVSIVGRVNIAVVSPVQTTVTIVESVDQDANAIEISVSKGFDYSINDSFAGVVGIIISETSGSPASTLLPGSKGFLIPFLLCLLMLCTRVRGAVFGVVVVLVCSLAFASAASNATVTITINPASYLNCLVLAVPDTTGSVADCSAVANLTCQVATSPDVLGSTCACLRKPVSTGEISAYSNPTGFTSSGSTFSCVYAQQGTVHANITNTDATPSCFDLTFQFESQSSQFNFNNVSSINAPNNVNCEYDGSTDAVYCTGIFDAGASVEVALDYDISSCCTDACGNLVTANVNQHKGPSLDQTGVVITINDSCE